jgi:hypothetical protein
VELKGVGYSADLKGKIVVYKVKLAGGNAWITGAPNSWAIPHYQQSCPPCPTDPPGG